MAALWRSPPKCAGGRCRAAEGWQKLHFARGALGRVARRASCPAHAGLQLRGAGRLLAQVLKRCLPLRNPHRIFFQFHKAPVVCNRRRLVAGRLKYQAAVKVRARKRRVNLQRAVKVCARLVVLLQRNIRDAAIVVRAGKLRVQRQAAAEVCNRLCIILQRQVCQPALHQRLRKLGVQLEYAVQICNRILGLLQLVVGRSAVVERL